ncbi:hypothetical protein [Bacillus sp. 3255]|uniref:hypothetical protein n=1 Tax=Bacillus sp. 3255 TaxID=2817904 RepID=UPI00286B9779|nr:hypothetical protein [Bacillus sp. 3255]
MSVRSASSRSWHKLRPYCPLNVEERVCSPVPRHSRRKQARSARSDRNPRSGERPAADLQPVHAASLPQIGGALVH